MKGTASGTLFQRGRLALAALAACALVALGCAPAAFAAETVTNTIGGLSYTIPSDWEEADLSGVEDEIAELQAEGLTDVVVYQHEDGVFFACAIEESGAEGATLEDAQETAQEMADSVPFATIQFSGSIEQNCPTVTMYTEDIVFNGVTYALTVKLYAASNAEFSGAVVMGSFLPASGVVTENFEDTFDATTEPVEMNLAGITYTIPAGVQVAEGSILGYDFAIGAGADGGAYEDAGFFALAYDLSGAYALVTVEDLQEMADDINESYASEPAVADVVTSLWAGATEFCGFPTFAFETTIADEEIVDGEMYLGTLVGMTDEGVSALLLFEESGTGLSDEIVASAVATNPAIAATASSEGTGAGSDSTDLGFVVGAAA